MSSSRRDDPSPSNASDDDIDFELATEESTPFPLGDDDDGEDAESVTYFDAEGDTMEDLDDDGVEFALEIPTDDATLPAEETEEQTIAPAADPAPAGYRIIPMTRQQLLHLLSQVGQQGIFQTTTRGMTTRSQGYRTRHVQLAADGEEEELDDEDRDDVRSRHRRRKGKPVRPYPGDRYPKVPSAEGRKLMESGEFGNVDRCDHSACGLPFPQQTLRKRRKLTRRMLDRELGLSGQGLTQRPSVLNALTVQNLVPSSKADLIVNMNARCYSGQFSEDGSFFFACGQDFKVRLYDTSNPYDWRYYKTVLYWGGQWTITDASLSPDNKLLAYSSIRAQVCLANTDQGDSSEPRLVDFSQLGPDTPDDWNRNRSHFGIWSLRFSGDGSEIVAGTSDQSVYVYDLEVGRSILRIPGHDDHVNAVCYGDKLSPHILYSGSDDTTLKVWDRRSLASMRPAGMFLGHTEGLTYIDSKGDGRYVISNGKDQTCKLWDLRKMISTDAGERMNTQDYTTNFDYRFTPYDTEEHIPHPHDCSVVTFHGHRVLKTLIRCHFSPPGSTDGRYIYSGSHDGRVYIWNLDGTIVRKIDVNASMRSNHAGDESHTSGRNPVYGGGGEWKTIVRDCSWHPSAPIIAATSWNGWDHGLGTCTVHSWADGVDTDEVEPDVEMAPGEAHSKASSLGSAPMGSRVTAQLNCDGRFYQRTPASRPGARATMLGNRMGLGALWADQDDDSYSEEDDDDDDDQEYDEDEDDEDDA